MCTKNEMKIHHKRAQEGRDWIDSKAQRAQGGWGLLSQSNPIQSLTNPKSNPALKRRTGRETQGRRPGRSRTIHGRNTKAAPNLIQVKGYLSPRRPVRPVPWTGQTGWLDRSDRCQGPVRPVGLQHPPVHDLI